jgi:hypothetical protein
MKPGWQTIAAELYGATSVIALIARRSRANTPPRLAGRVGRFTGAPQGKAPVNLQSSGDGGRPMNPSGRTPPNHESSRPARHNGSAASGRGRLLNLALLTVHMSAHQTKQHFLWRASAQPCRRPTDLAPAGDTFL